MKIYIILAALLLFLVSVQSVLAEDCDSIRDEKVCWDKGTETTLSWSYAKTTISGYQIEVRDFNWLGSVFIRVTHNNTVREGMLSQGEGFIFDFSNGTGFQGVKIIAGEVSNINPMPANTGVYPNDPRAKITVKFIEEDEQEIPELGLSVSTIEEKTSGSIITAEINLENSGNGDIMDTELTIFYGSLKLRNEYDAVGGYFSEGTMAVSDIAWENVSKYRLSRSASTILKDGFLIEILNFSERTIMLRSTYNFSTKSGTITEGGSMIFNFTSGENYKGFRLLGGNFSIDSAELTMQLPVKNSLKRKYSYIQNGKTESVKFSFLIPPNLKRSFSIFVNASGNDASGAVYTASKYQQISASETLKITKRVSDSILGERIYPESYYEVGGIRSKKEVTYVNIRVDNLQNYPVYGIKLVETIPPSFNFINDTHSTSISWDFDINASDFREFRYEIKARRPGVYNLPKSELAWNEWGDQVNIYSDSPRTTVSGPYLGIERSLNKSSLVIGDRVQVTLIVVNNGDVPTNITLKEKVPVNATFLSGNLYYSGFLNPGETAQISYNISASDVLDFKPPEISSRNTGFEWYAPLPQKKIMVSKTISSSTTEDNTPEVNAAAPPSQQQGILDIIDERLPWLEGAVSMLTLLFGIFVLIKLNKLNRTL